MSNDQDRRDETDRHPVEVIVRSPADSGDSTPRPVPQSTRVNLYTRASAMDSASDDNADASAERARRGAMQQRRFTIGKLIDLWSYLVTALEALLALRFFFELAGANQGAGFVQFVLGVTKPFAWPFNGIFYVPRQAQYAFDPNVIIAMIVYVLIGAGVARLLAFLIEPPSTV